MVRAFCRAVDVVLQDPEHVRPALDTRFGSVPVLGQVYLLDHVIRAAGVGESVKTQKNHQVEKVLKKPGFVKYKSFTEL